MKEWRILESAYPVSNRWLKVRRDTCQLPDGRVIDDFYVLVENDVGSVFALTPDRRVVLVEQYKHGIGQVCLELPAGCFEAHDSNPLAAARREFMEETGYDAAEYRYLGRLAQSPTRMTNYFHTYLALDVFPTASGQQLDPTEDITVRLIPLDEVFAMIASGAIHAVATVAGIYMGWAALNNPASGAGAPTG